MRTYRYFRQASDTAMNNIAVLRTFISEQELYSSPCPLLEKQLDELSLWARKLQEQIAKVKELEK